MGIVAGGVLVDIVHMDKIASAPARPASPSHAIDLEQALPRSAHSSPRACHALVLPRPLAMIVALCYATLASALAAAAVFGDPSRGMAAPSVGTCALAACAVCAVCAVGWLPGRKPWVRDLAPAALVAWVLFAPAPWAIPVVALTILVATATVARGGALAAAVASAAHAILSATLLIVAAHAALGDGRLPRAVMALARDPVALAHALRAAPAPAGLAASAPVAAPWSVAAPHAPGTFALLLLVCAAYYLLQTVPPALARAISQRRRPLRAWADLYGHALPLQLAALPLGPVALALYAAAPALALLALPPACGALWLAARLRRAREREDEARVLRDDTAALYARAADAEERAERGDTHLEALLAAMQGIGASDDPAGVTTALVGAATRLTAFRACTVYLYESRDGVFVPYAERLEGARHGETMSRARVEAMMSPRNRLGYNYYIPRALPDTAEDLSTAEEGASASGRVSAAEPGLWKDGDVLLAPLLLKNGDVAGYMRLDRPSDGRVPAAGDLTPLETLASLAASAIARLRQTDAMLHLAASDGLTGLLNRRAFEGHLRRETAAATRRDRSLALMMIDIDDFGAVNNRHGHPVGDAALRLVAGVIRAHLRESDAGARYGGDEFVVVLPELDAAGAADIAERLRAALAERTRRAAADGALPRIYTSIGVAAFPHHAGDPTALIKAADDALYASKGLGKNCVSIATA